MLDGIAFDALTSDMLHDKKDQLLQVRMTKFQLRQTKILAKRAKCSPAEYVRGMLARRILEHHGYRGN